MKHSSTPAWSFGSYQDPNPKTTNKHSPSPDKYNVSGDMRATTYSFGNGPRGDLYKMPNNPGPADYNKPGFLDSPS